MQLYPVTYKGQIKYTEIDDEDVYWVARHGWSINTKGYCVAKINKKIVKLHRFIAKRMGLNIEGKEVDHKNRNKLNNQRSNLRIANNSQQSANQSVRSDSATGIKGIYKIHDKRFKAIIKVNQEQIYLGYYDNEKDAQQAYIQAAIKYFGEFACIG